MILSDAELWGNPGIGIEPFNVDRVNPASYDLTLGPEILTFTGYWFDGIVDPREDTDWMIHDRWELGKDGFDFILQPGQLILGHTNEVITLSNKYAGRVDGKSSLGRLGLVVHITAGFIDPGFSGQITLEIYNTNPLPIILFRDMPICQISFEQLSHPATFAYDEPLLGSKYQGQMGASPSRYFKNFTTPENPK